MPNMTDPIGLTLKNLRQQKNLTLQDVARETCVSRAFLMAIEDADYDQLPAQAFTVGFIKAYAQLVGYDVCESVRQFKADVNTSSEAETESEACSQDSAGDSLKSSIAAGAVSGHSIAHSVSRSNSLAATFSLLGLVATVMIFGWTADSTIADQQSAQTFAAAADQTLDKPVKETKAETEIPLVEPAAVDTKNTLFPAVQASEPSNPVVTDLTAVLVAVEDNWVQLQTADGDTVWQGIMAKGQSRILTDDVSHVTTGNSGGLEMKVGSRSLGLLGQRGVMARSLALPLISSNAQ